MRDGIKTGLLVGIFVLLAVSMFFQAMTVGMLRKIRDQEVAPAPEVVKENVPTSVEMTESGNMTIIYMQNDNEPCLVQEFETVEPDGSYEGPD